MSLPAYESVTCLPTSAERRSQPPAIASAPEPATESLGLPTQVQSLPSGEVMVSTKVKPKKAK
jgi:hypothetical protein